MPWFCWQSEHQVGRTIYPPFYFASILEKEWVAMDRYRFDFALSFAGQTREVASDLASQLKQQGFAVFYDEDFEHEMIGQDGSQYLRRVYSRDSRYCIVLISEQYDRSQWTDLERESIQARELRGEKGILIPVLVDGYRPAWLPETRIYFDLPKRALANFVAIVSKLSGVDEAKAGTRRLAARLIEERHAELWDWWIQDIRFGALDKSKYDGTVRVPSPIECLDDVIAKYQYVFDHEASVILARYRAKLEPIVTMFRMLCLRVGESHDQIRHLVRYASLQFEVIDFTAIKREFDALMKALDYEPTNLLAKWTDEETETFAEDYELVKSEVAKIP
jgi:hypothetical protein